MKRILSLILSSALLCTIIFTPNTVGAETYGVLTYENYGDCIEITGCDKNIKGTVEIPNEIDGLPVTLIGDYAFKDCTGLTSVNIPSSVTYIGNGAFRGCGILNIEVSEQNNEYASIDGVLFSKDKTRIISYAKDVIQPDYAVPSGVTEIGIGAFRDCAGLTSVNIPSSVTIIAKSVFYGCAALTSVNIPSSVSIIRDYAFYGCTALTSVNIPSSVTYIFRIAFSGCGRLNIEVSEQNNYYTSIDGVLFNKDKTQIVSYAKDVIQPNYAIPSSVTEIGGYAFKGCTALTSVNIPSSVEYIGDSAFRDCTALTSVNIPSSVKYIDGNAFFRCAALTSVNIPSGVIGIDRYAFYGCAALTSVNIPSSVTYIGASAFSGCGRLNIEVSEQNNEYASIDGVLFNKDKTTIISYAKDVIQPDYAIPSGVTEIGGYAFENCAALTSVNIPSSVTYIGDYAFEGCTGVTSVNIPNSVTRIGDYAFERCGSLSNVYYGGSEAEWESIGIDSGNDDLTTANIHYNSTMPSESTPTPKPTLTPTQKPTPTPTQNPSPTPTPTLKPTADPNAPAIEIAEVSEHTVKVNVKNCDCAFAQVILAVYNLNGTLRYMTSKSAAESMTFNNIDLSNSNIKVMLWSNLDTLKPLAECAEMSFEK